MFYAFLGKIIFEINTIVLLVLLRIFYKYNILYNGGFRDGFRPRLRSEVGHLVLERVSI